METIISYWIVPLAVAVIIFLRYFFKPVMWHVDGRVMAGKTVIVTGATSGIGLETATELTRFGAKVIMACRNVQKAEETKQDIVKQLAGEFESGDLDKRIVVQHLELSSFKSIRSFAENILRTEKRLDVLVNNAGCDGSTTRTVTQDGLEMVMGTNHFGHFLLTNLLLPLLRSSAPSRVIVVSSVAHMLGKVDFEDLNGEKSYWLLPFLGLTTAYCNSKLANLLFAQHLASLLKDTGVTVTALHPGPVGTQLFRNSRRVFQILFDLGKRLVLRTPLEGAQTSLYLAASASPDAQVNGAYYVDCKSVKPSKHARDSGVAKKLWEVSEKITGLA